MQIQFVIQLHLIVLYGKISGSFLINIVLIQKNLSFYKNYLLIKLQKMLKMIEKK